MIAFYMANTIIGSIIFDTTFIILITLANSFQNINRRIEILSSNEIPIRIVTSDDPP